MVKFQSQLKTISKKCIISIGQLWQDTLVMKNNYNWCKKQILYSNGQEFRPIRITNAPQTLLNQQLIKRTVSENSISYYQKLFQTVLYLVEEELAFTKLQGLVELQMHNGSKFGSADKLNDKACSEIVNVIATVIVDCLTDYFKECNFITASTDTCEAHKTSEEKELVFQKVMIQSRCSMLFPS